MLPAGLGGDHPIQLVTSLMRYDAHISRGGFWLDPVLPESYGDLHITNAPMAGGRITIDVAGSYIPGSGTSRRAGHSTVRNGHGFTELVERAELRRTEQQLDTEWLP